MKINFILKCFQRALQMLQVFFIFKDLTWKQVRTVQWVKALVPKPNNLNLISSIHKAEGEN